MKNSGYVQYYVEGECEEKLINALKTEMQLIIPGKVQRLNVVQDKISKARLMNLRENTTVVLIFDIDVVNEDILYNNIETLSACSRVKKIICIPQVKNFEDELKRACSIKNITEFTQSKSNVDFKKDFIKMSNLKSKLLKHNFDLSKLWACECTNILPRIQNGSELIKLDH